MSWQKEVDEIGKRKTLAEAMGGPEKLKNKRPMASSTRGNG